MQAIPSANLQGLTRTSSGYEGVLRLLERDVKVTIDFDGCSEDSTLNLAEQIVGSIRGIDEKCRNLIADDSLDGYNSDWRTGQVLQPDGSTRSFENPEMERHEFIERLLLSSIGVSGDQTSDIWYECGDLFWGHSLFVTAFDGVAFDDVHVQMFG